MNLEAIDETSYLSAPNVKTYRNIMRCFYREYEKMRYRLYKEDVLNLLRQEEGFEEYKMEQLEDDLDSLVRWKNLTPIQDPGKVYSIAEYKNKQYRYSMSETAVEIERMTVRLENIFLESGNLSANFFVRLEKSLEEVTLMRDAPLKEVNEWWRMLQEDFKRLDQNYKDYLRDFYSGKSERLMKSVEFVLYKDKFIGYLTDFVQKLQHHSKRIEKILLRECQFIEGTLLERVVQSEQEIPHALLAMDGDLEPNIRDNVMGKWESLKRWFLDSPDAECESRNVMRITNEVIRNIIQNAALIVQMQNWGISRKEDYQKFLQMFLKCEDMEEAHRLSAHVFGIQRICHFKTNQQREEDAMNRSVYEEDPAEFYVRPRHQTYREKKDRRGFEDKTMEKMIQREAYLRHAKEQEATVMRYVRDGKITFSEMEGIISEGTRDIFLQWITAANMDSQRLGQTEFGQRYRLSQEEGTCVLHCSDGDLTMPSYVMEFL